MILIQIKDLGEGGRGGRAGQGRAGQGSRARRGMGGEFRKMIRITDTLYHPLNLHQDFLANSIVIL